MVEEVLRFFFFFLVGVRGISLRGDDDEEGGKRGILLLLDGFVLPPMLLFFVDCCCEEATPRVIVGDALRVRRDDDDFLSIPGGRHCNRYFLFFLPCFVRRGAVNGDVVFIGSTLKRVGVSSVLVTALSSSTSSSIPNDDE